MDLDLQNPLTSFQVVHYDDVTPLFAKESDHMPCLLSFDSSDSRFAIRRSVFALVSHAKLSYNLDPVLVYLSLNYVDRFLSKQEILEKRPWIAHILVVASLSLAAKMRNSDLSILLTNLQRGEGFDFDSKSVQRMETILLATLQWRMRSITPFSFLQYFLSLPKIEDSSLSQRLKHQASNIIFNVQCELKFLEYKPSTIAASALLSAVLASTPPSFSSFHAAISSCEYVNKDKLSACVSLMQEITGEGYESSPAATASSTLTAINFVDRQRTSSRSEDSGISEMDAVKRRRLNGLCNNRTNFQISQTQHC